PICRPLPLVTKVAEVKVVGQVGRDRGGESGDQERRLLGPWSARRCLPQAIARKRTADINLLLRQLEEAVIAITRHEVPFLSEIMIQPHDPEVRSLRQADRAEIALLIDTVN